MKSIYIKLSIILIVLSFVSLQIQSGPRKKLGTMAAPELLIPLGSIGTSLQGSAISRTTGVDAMFWNPAGMSQIETNTADVMFSHMNYFADLKMEYLAGIVKIGSIGILGASIRSLDFGEPIIVTTENNPDGTGETYSPTYLTANLGFARAMTDKVHFGANIKLISERIAQVSAVGYAFDFGLQYIAGSSGIRFGIALKNLGSSMKFDGPGLDREFTVNGESSVRRITLQEFDLPTTLEIGASYQLTFSKNNNVAVSTAFLNSGFTSDEYKFGLEYNFKRYVFLRGAFTLYPDKEADEALFGPSFGAGIKYPFGAMTIGIDYAYRFINEKGFDSHNQFFTLNIGF